MTKHALAERPSHVPPERAVDIDIYGPPGSELDIHRAWTALHEQGAPDVVWTPHNGGHWIVTRAEPMREVYENYRSFSSRVGLVPKEQGASALIPASLDPPRHRAFRTLLNSSFAPKIIQHARENIRSVAANLIDGFAAKGNCEFQNDYALKFPVSVFMAMMNLPFEDAVKVKNWSDQITHNLGDLTREEAEAQFYAYLEPYIASRMSQPGDDIISRLVNSEIDGQPMSMDLALPLTAQVLQGGVETVVNFLGFVIIHLAGHPEHRRLLINEPAKIGGAVDEFFRRFGIVINAREVAEDTELGGTLLKAGDAIVMPNMLSGLDEREHANPYEVDFDRVSKQHLSFGAGSHRCPGAPLARLEVEITISEWLRRIPEFTFAPDFAPRYRSGVTPDVDRIPLVWTKP